MQKTKARSVAVELKSRNDAFKLYQILKTEKSLIVSKLSFSLSSAFCVVVQTIRSMACR